MTRRLKTVGLALLAVVALTALVAPATQAEGVGTITAESYTASVTSTQITPNVFKIGTGGTRNRMQHYDLLRHADRSSDERHT